jgi:hypothetical protein
MRTLNLNEMSAVGGGDRWGDSEEGRATSESETNIQAGCSTAGNVLGTVGGIVLGAAVTAITRSPALGGMVGRVVGTEGGNVIQDGCVDVARRLGGSTITN